jgi:hypothetical protein
MGGASSVAFELLIRHGLQISLGDSSLQFSTSLNESHPLKALLGTAGCLLGWQSKK